MSRFQVIRTAADPAARSINYQVTNRGVQAMISIDLLESLKIDEQIIIVRVEPAAWTGDPEAQSP